MEERHLFVTLTPDNKAEGIREGRPDYNFRQYVTDRALLAEDIMREEGRGVANDYLLDYTIPEGVALPPRAPGKSDQEYFRDLVPFFTQHQIRPKTVELYDALFCKKNGYDILFLEVGYFHSSPEYALEKYRYRHNPPSGTSGLQVITGLETDKGVLLYTHPLDYPRELSQGAAINSLADHILDHDFPYTYLRYWSVAVKPNEVKDKLDRFPSREFPDFPPPAEIMVDKKILQDGTCFRSCNLNPTGENLFQFFKFDASLNRPQRLLDAAFLRYFGEKGFVPKHFPYIIHKFSYAGQFRELKISDRNIDTPAGRKAREKAKALAEQILARDFPNIRPVKPPVQLSTASEAQKKIEARVIVKPVPIPAKKTKGVKI